MAVGEIATHQTRANLYPLAFRLEERFGRCVGVHLIRALSAEPAVLTGLLHADERALCQSMKGARLVEWVGGRVASKLARIGISGAECPTLRNSRGAPEVGAGARISLSHSRSLAVALASAESGYSIGVDVEAVAIEGFEEQLLAEKILSPVEQRVPVSSSWGIETVQRFSIKEAVYKAAFPLTERHRPLREISVQRLVGSRSEFQVFVPVENLRVEAVSFRVDEHILSLARACTVRRTDNAASDAFAQVGD